MNILIITQKIDRNDSILGFFHRWVESFAAKAAIITVICLQKGDAQLPSNVRVLSLGKEFRSSRLRYVRKLYMYLWRYRKEYDVVFVHMNPVYVLLGCVFWRIMQKKYFIWYNHKQDSLTARMAIRSVHTAFHTSPYAFTARFSHSCSMPAGIDTDLFRKHSGIIKEPNSILYAGRIAPIKKIHILLEAAEILDRQAVDFVLSIVGEAESHESNYLQSMQEVSRALQRKGKVRFLGKIPNQELPEVYNRSEAAVNLSPAGLFDKTVLEAMACETLMLVSSKAFEDILPPAFMFEEDNAVQLAARLKDALGLEAEAKKTYGRRFRSSVKERHSLERLTRELFLKLG